MNVPRAGRAAAVLCCLVALGGASCSSGSGGGPAEGSTTTTAPPDPVHQPRLRIDIAPAVLAELANGIDGRFRLVEDATVVFDPTVGELQYDSAAQQARYEFAGQHGFLGLFSVVFETPDGGEFWELTIEVFGEDAGARALFDAHGTAGGGAVANSELVFSDRQDVGGGRTGTVHVERYAFRAAAEGRVHEQGEFYELRGGLVDGNVVVNVLALIDAESPEAADPFGAVRRALAVVEGKHRAHYLAAGGR